MDSSGLKEDIFYSSSWMQEILEISNIGLWLLEINKNNTDVRLYADDKMLELLGLQKSLSLEDNYKHFAQGVLAEDLEILQKYIEQMLTTKRLVEVQYRWKHPWWGTIFIRCSGKLYKEDDNAYYIRGYHQNASDVEVLRQANIEKSRQLIEVVRKVIIMTSCFSPYCAVSFNTGHRLTEVLFFKMPIWKLSGFLVMKKKNSGSVNPGG